MKFSDRMRLLSMVFLSGAVFNRLLNLWLVPLYGYEWAAISTLITYILLVLFLSIREGALLHSLSDPAKKMRIPMFVLALQVLVFAIVDNFELSMPVRIAIGLIFVTSYGWLLKRSSILWKKR